MASTLGFRPEPSAPLDPTNTIGGVSCEINQSITSNPSSHEQSALLSSKPILSYNSLSRSDLELGNRNMLVSPINSQESFRVQQAHSDFVNRNLPVSPIISQESLQVQYATGWQTHPEFENRNLPVSPIIPRERSQLENEYQAQQGEWDYFDQARGSLEDRFERHETNNKCKSCLSLAWDFVKILMYFVAYIFCFVLECIQ